MRDCPERMYRSDFNATTLMHKSTLSTNNSGNNHFGQKYQKQKILRIFRRTHWCLFEKFPTKRAKKRKSVFGQIFQYFESFVTLKKFLWSFISSIDASDVSATAGIICRRKSFQKLLQKLILKLLILKINVLNKDVKIILLLFAISSENSKL